MSKALRKTGNHATITEYYATARPRVRKVRKFAIYGPQPTHSDDADMRGVQELVVSYIKPRERLFKDSVCVLHGATIGYGYNGTPIVHRNRHYVLIEQDGELLFDSRDVFPCDMQEFLKNREDYVTEMAKRGWSRLDFTEPEVMS